jgi:hypothetical protein
VFVFAFTFTRLRSEDASVTPEPDMLPVIPAAVHAVLLFAVVLLRVLVLDEERWCRRCEGAGWLGPESRWFALTSPVSGKPAEVDEALETTEAFWAARSMESSRVRRLT